MSYDLQVWSVNPADQASLRVPAGHGWQLVVNPSNLVLEEDIPEGANSLVPGIQYLTELNLEGPAPEAAMKAAVKTASALARTCLGVVLDPQQGTLVAPSGVKRLRPAARTEAASSLVLSWWFADGPLLYRSGRERFLNVLEEHLPEALPRRYGLWEPPQYLYAETGRQHLLDCLDEHIRHFVVWYAHKPLRSLHIGIPSPYGGSARGFRSNHLRVEVDSGVLSQPGWQVQLQRFWMALNQLIEPFYSEVRSVCGNRGLEPVRGWFWRGIPEPSALAIALGPAYQQLWPEFLSRATLRKSMAELAVEIWTGPETLEQRIGHVPGSIAARPFVWPPGTDPINAPVNTPESYPDQWPFEAPFR